MINITGTSQLGLLENRPLDWQSILRLVDALELEGESKAQKLKRQALGKVSEHLRNTGTL